MNRFLLLLVVLLSASLAWSQTERGKATYYGRKHNGCKTASGERLYNDSMVCAHRSYKFGTRLRVKNLKNGREVIVRVIDRGPFRRGLVVDLSYGAAQALDMVRAGIVPCEVTVVKPDDPPTPTPEPQQ